jgi:cholesterol oxidase
MRDHYSAVVIGSGYGGAIAAARIARTGRDVCVLERGRELHPGEYPNSALTALREVQVHTPTADRGSATAMFDFHADRDITVLVGCGLGGTSLINANVALEPGDSVFADPRWPAELRDRPAVLKPFMQLARTMLGSNPYPADWPELPKLAALKRAAEGLRRGPDGDAVTLTRPDINVTFTAGPNAAGIHQAACVLCGDCCSGCNHGAKNTVLMNYLPDAHSRGAHIFTEVAVRSVRRWQDTWRVDFEELGTGRDRYGDVPAHFVTADVVVLAAGTLGSTQILLRSRTAGLTVSDRLGYGFSGNGDVLAFAYDTDQPVQGVGFGHRTPANGSVVGPTITGLIDLRHPGADPGEALIIQEGAIPGALAALLPAVMYAASVENPGRVQLPQARRLRQLAGIPLGSYRGPIDRTLTYLITSTDDSGGRIVITDDRVRVEWPGLAEAPPAFVRDGELLTTATEALRGTPVPDPLWAWSNGRSLITVHPLGGCVMADDAANGVVDHKGRVFDPQGGGVHEGLYVCDGSVVPVALAANPLLTISAIAERTVDILIKDRNWDTGTADGPAGPDRQDMAGTTPTPAAEASPVTRKARLTFTERMTGFVSAGAGGDFGAGHARGPDDGALAEALLTIDYEDVQAVLNDPACQAAVSGTVLASGLSPHRMEVTRGRFTLFEVDPSQPETWHMRYQMDLLAQDGKRYVFDGHKVIRKRGTRHAWSDTTTLYTTIQELDGPGHVTGILSMRPADFARLLRTLNVRGVPLRKQLEYRLAFGALFAGELARRYGGALNPAEAFPVTPRRAPAAAAVREPGDPAGIWWYDEPAGWHAGGPPGDAAFLRLIRYNADGPRGPVMLATGFGMSAHSFLSPTVGKNMAEFLAEAGHDVWLFDYRAGIDLPSSRTDFTIDDIARRDWPLAVAKVLEVTGRDDVQAFGHCVGSLSLQMAVLAGLTGVRSAVCAQFPLHPVTSTFNQVKSGWYVADALRGSGLRNVSPATVPSLPDALLDTLFRTLPMPAEERCGQAVCRWINAIYGCTHRHAQLNDATHRALNEMFGTGNLEAIRHLSLMMRRGLALTHDGGRDYLEHPERFTGTKLLLLQGRRNYIFHPDGTLRTLRWLREDNSRGHYERVVLPGYAHLDAIVGSRAAAEVYPQIAGFFDRT